jgi:hypothetical protein
MSIAAFRFRLGVLGLSVRSFAAVDSPRSSALGAADARNGPDSIAEAAGRRREPATSRSDDARHDPGWQQIFWQQCAEHRWRHEKSGVT